MQNNEITRTYYHVTDRPWDGSALLPYNDCADECGELDEYERGVDPDVVCLYDDLADAEHHHADVTNSAGNILAITVTYDPTEGHIYNMSDYGTPKLVTVPEGFVAIRGWIPASAIKVAA